MRPALTFLLLGLVLLPLCACGSTRSSQSNGDSPAEAGGRAIRVTYLAYKSGQEFELRSVSHTPRAELYSQRTALDAATTKVSEDPLMVALVQTLKSDDDGLGSSLQSGRGTRDGRGVLWQMIEIEVGGNTSHSAIGSGSSMEEIESFQHAAQVFLAVYNSTVGYQVVDNPGGKHTFATPGSGPR